MKARTPSTLFPRLLIVVILAFAILQFTQFSPVYAVDPVQQSHTVCDGTGATQTCTITPHATGDLLVASVNSGRVSGTCNSISSVLGSHSGLFSAAVTSGCGADATTGVAEITAVYYGVAASTAADTITITFSAATGQDQGAVVYDISGAAANVITTGINSGSNVGCANPCTISTTASLSFSEPVFRVAAFSYFSENINFPTTNWADTTVISLGANTNRVSAYRASSGLSSPNSFTFNVSTNDNSNHASFALAVAIFGATGGAGNCASSTTCNANPVTLTIGNVEVVTIQWSNQANTISSLTDTLGNTWTQLKLLSSCDSSGCIDGHTVQTAVYDSLITVGGTSTITVTMTTSTTTIGIVTYSLVNVNPQPICAAGWQTTTGVTSTVIATSTSCSSSPTNTDIASIAGLGAFALTAGASYTLTTSTASGNFGAETANINGNTVFPASIASATVVVEIGLVFAPTSTGSTQTLGSCPTKNTATFTMVNSTQYFWTTNQAATNEVINTIQAEVASVNSGHAASETLYFAIYATANSGAISASNPFQLAGFKTWTLSPTALPQNLVWTAGLTFNSPAGATIGISIVGNSKIVLNQSSLSGMFTGASGAVAGTTGVPNGQFTALSSTATQLFFCGTLSFQSVITSTSTVTVTGSTTVTQTITFTTSTANAPNPNQLAFWFIPIIFMMIGVGITTGIGTGVSGVQNMPLESGTLVFLVVLGLFLGSWFGTLANVTPLGLSLLLTAMLVIVAWRR